MTALKLRIWYDERPLSLNLNFGHKQPSSLDNLTADSLQAIEAMNGQYLCGRRFVHF